MLPQDAVLGTLSTFAMGFGLFRFGDWVIVEKLKLNKDPKTYALAWALYISILTIGVLMTLVFLHPP